MTMGNMNVNVFPGPDLSLQMLAILKQKSTKQQGNRGVKADGRTAFEPKKKTRRAAFRTVGQSAHEH